MNSTTMKQPLGTIVQTSYVVDDLATQIEHWIQTGIAGPFYLLEHLELDQPIYRGKPTTLDISIALGYSGGVCVELVQQHDDEPSVYREHPTTPGATHHHVAIMTEAFDDELTTYAARGCEAIFEGAVVMGGRFAYVDTLERVGCLIELIELTPMVRELFATIEAAAVEWDGSDPVRRL